MSRRKPKVEVVLHSRAPLKRMEMIHAAIVGGGFPNSSTLAEDLEVSPKTIKRDVEFMRDQLELPLEYDAQRYGYHYTRPVTQFPPMKISEGELLALFVAEKAVAQYQGTPYGKVLHAAFEKIVGGLHEYVTIRMRNPGGDISFRQGGVGEADIAVFETVQAALVGRVELEFFYRPLNATTHTKRRVRPYHLACVDHQWYLFAFDLARNGMRTFVLARMKRPETTKHPFVRPKEFSLAEHLDGAFGVFPGREGHTVTVRFDAFASQLVRERKWHPTQELKEIDDDCVELTVSVGNFHEISRWIMSWEDHAVVVKPAALRRKMRETLTKMATHYRE
jgi:proteasome accessory factor B